MKKIDINMSMITEERLASLSRRYRKEYPELPIRWINFAQWMNATIRPNVIYSSWAAYRHSFDSVCPSEEAKALLRNTKAASRSSIKRSGSRQRRKRITQVDMDRLEEYFKSKSSWKWGYPAMVWVRCGVLVGLRPYEWIGATIEGEYYLVVDNTKLNKTTGEHWPSRIIPLNHLSKSEVKMIRTWIKTVKSYHGPDRGDGYRVLYTGCRKWLYEANKKIWPKRRLKLQLMSARHQFMANLKANAFSPMEIAYLVGHSSDLRSYESYGSTSFGQIGANLPDTSHISEEDFDRITKKLESKFPNSNVPKISNEK